jgi:hypothetical protein
MALAVYDDLFWFPNGAMAANVPARIFPEESSVLAPLFSDATGLNALPNPLNTGSDGRLRFWAETGYYWVHIDSESFRVGVGVSDEGISLDDVRNVVTGAITDYNTDTTDVHGIPNTADLETQAGAQAKADAAQAAAEDDSNQALTAHAAATQDVHGIPDTADLETLEGAQAKADAAGQAAVTTARQEAAAALADHAADTTNVHGIPNTGLLETTAGAQAKANAAEGDAITVAAADASAKANAAQQTAIGTAADDATTKANNAQAAAAADATAKANNAQATAISTAAADATTKATSARNAAAQALLDHAGDTTDVHGISDTSLLLTQADVTGIETELHDHEAATTDVHGIADTSQLLTTVAVDGITQELHAHEAATTDGHGIADTSQLLTTVAVDGITQELHDHEAATTSVHGIADTADLLTATDLTPVTDELHAHEAATTNVHGIADTADLLTTVAVDGITQELHDHEAATTDVHGIADTSALETKTGAQAKADAAEDGAVAAAGAALAVHEAATTSVHGIADTAALETKTGAQAKADTAQSAAVSAAAADATTKANAAQSAAVSTAAADATTKANNAQAAAISAAATDATTKANNAASGAASALAAHEADTTNIHGIADTAALETKTGAQAKANNAQSAATSAAATDATTKANNAQAAAISAAATDATTKANNAQAAAISAAATDAQTKANAGRDAAIADAATKYLAKTGGGTFTGTLRGQHATDPTQAAFASNLTSDTVDRWRALISGQLEWGPGGSTTRDVKLLRTAAGQMQLQGSLEAVLGAAATLGLAVKVTGDSYDRLTVNSDGQLAWGTGATAATFTLEREPTNDGLAIRGGTLRAYGAATGGVTFAARITGDTASRWYITGGGTQFWGPGGSSGADIQFGRIGTAQMQLTGSLDHVLATAATMGMGLRVTGDTADRFAIDASGNITWGSGSAAADIHMHRAAAGLLLLDESMSVSGLITVTGSASVYGVMTVYNSTNLRPADTASAALDMRIPGDAQPRFFMDGSGDCYWGDGTNSLDTSLYRYGSLGLVTDGDFTVNGNLYVGGQLASTVEAQMLPAKRYETTSRLRCGTSSSPVSGQLFLSPIYLPAGVSVTQIGFVSASTAGATLTHQWFMLLDSSRVGLARTADATTAAWNANTVKSLAIAQTSAGTATSFTTTYNGLYYLGLMIAATTPPTLLSEGTIVGGVGGNVAPYFGGSATGQTTPPNVTANGYTAPQPSGNAMGVYGYVTIA